MDLYPENADWDPVHCKLYLGAAYNASFVAYDPYTYNYEAIAIPGITHNPDYEVSGVDYDARTGSMYICVTFSKAFSSTITGNASLANFTGLNAIVKYGTSHRNIDYVASFEPIQRQIQKQTGRLVNGFQDMAEDTRGNSYAIATFGNVIVKVRPSGVASLWHKSPNIKDLLGFEGIFSLGDKLVVSNRLVQGFMTFDTMAKVVEPKIVRPRDLPDVQNHTVGWDGLTAPSKYCGRVALSADDAYGTRVFGSQDGWESAEYIGGIPRPKSLQAGSSVFTISTANFEIGATIYALTSFFQLPHARDPSIPIQRRNEFPMTDITKRVDQLVQKWNNGRCCE